MAEVHVGKDARLGRTVAIKLLRSDLARDPAFQTRFRREAQAAASLNHPAIVAVYDTGEDVSTDAAGTVHHLPFIIMEYVEGHTLRELMRDGAALPIDEASDITIGVLSALQYAHHAGIVHRDIKPANIMLTVTGQVKVMDFGIARALAETQETVTQAQAVIGTAQYLSPEQARGETVDARSDLYSTGCVLFELLTGTPPFVGDSAVAVAYQHVREAPVPPSVRAPDVPPVLDQIVLKALAKDRNLRYSTASEFLADLEAAKHGRRVSAPPVAPPAAADATQVLAPTAATTPVTRPNFGAAGILPDQAEVNAEEAEDAAARKKRIIIISVVAGIAVIALGLLAYFMLRGDGGDKGGPTSTAVEQVKVPPVPASRLPEDAVTALKEAGFKAEKAEDVSDEVEAGKVIGFDPESGTQLDRGKTVKYVVSVGASQIKVPDVKTLSQADARTKLEQAGLKVSTTTKAVNSPDVPVDMVVGTDPALDTMVPRGQEVILQISNGNTTVPDCIGKPEAECRTLLEEAGLKVGDVAQATSDQPPGSVIDQSVAANSPASQGSRVNLKVSRAKQSKDMPDLANMTEAQARNTLDLLGLSLVIQTRQEQSTGVAQGNVIKSEPATGGRVTEGDTVVLVVSSGPPATGESATPNP
jgi:serine/threonine-protein kinase